MSVVTPNSVLSSLRTAVDELVEMNNDQREEGRDPEPNGAMAEYQARKALSSLAAHLNEAL